MFLPNQDQIQGIARWLIAAGSGYAIGNGWLTQDQVAQFTPYIIGLVPLVWGLFIHKKAATVARAADIVPIPPQAQRDVGITAPQVTPTRPKLAT